MGVVVPNLRIGALLIEEEGPLFCGGDTVEELLRLLVGGLRLACSFPSDFVNVSVTEVGNCFIRAWIGSVKLFVSIAISRLSLGVTLEESTAEVNCSFLMNLGDSATQGVSMITLSLRVAPSCERLRCLTSRLLMKLENEGHFAHRNCPKC